MGTYKDRIAADLKEAMKARDQLRVDTLRSALSGFTYKRTESGNDLSDADEMDVLRKQVKQRSDAATEFEKAARPELAQKELREREILTAYLPAQMNADQVRAIVREVLSGLPSDGRNQGAVMKLAMPRLKGQADGNLVRQIVTEELQ